MRVEQVVGELKTLVLNLHLDFANRLLVVYFLCHAVEDVSECLHTQNCAVGLLLRHDGLQQSLRASALLFVERFPCGLRAGSRSVNQSDDHCVGVTLVGVQGPLVDLNAIGLK